MNEPPTRRADVLSVLKGEQSDQHLCFSGLIAVTEPGLDDLGFHLSEVHHDAGRMTAAAASTHRLFGFDSATVPLDMCVEAELLGATIDFGTPDDDEPHLPEPAGFLAATVNDLKLEIPDDPAGAARVPVVCEAIRILKEDYGEDLAIGAWVPGPFTLAALILDIGELLMSTSTHPGRVGEILDRLTGLLIGVAGAYHRAGADFLTVHEMGGSPGFVGPGAFEQLVLPRLQRLLAALPDPTVLHVCGRTNMAMDLLAATGARALSVDQLNDLDNSRTVLATQVLLGNIDPVGTLADGTTSEVREAVGRSIESGVDAVWPGCDLTPRVPAENLRAMVEETHNPGGHPPASEG